MFNLWFRKILQRRKQQPTPVFLLGKSHGQRSLAGYSSWGHRVGHDLVVTEHTRAQTAFRILFPSIEDRMRPRCHCLINDSQLLPNLVTFLTLSDSTFDGVTDKPILDCCACGTAKYRLTFYGNWSEKTHPKDYPREQNSYFMRWGKGSYKVLSDCREHKLMLLTYSFVKHIPNK